jgi:flavin-dependent dehydrogenase
VRHDALATWRRDRTCEVGDTVLEHVRQSCRGVREALHDAQREGPWLAAGPIRPGIRLRCALGVFPVGNLAGEAHPVVAEGISMALQGAWLLVEHLERWRRRDRLGDDLAHVHLDYARPWRRQFAPRVHVAAVIAQWAMRPHAVAAALPLLRRWPRLLNWGARLSGKDRRIGLQTRKVPL